MPDRTVRSLIRGTGAHVPPHVVTNESLSDRVNTSDEWIIQRTGIRTRHLLEPNDLPSDMAVAAGREALQEADLAAEDLELLIVATNFPDMTCPGTAPFVAQDLGMTTAPFFDITAGCTGFVYGVAVADGLITSGAFGNALIIGMEALSRVTDWADRRTCVLFGDGAGAAVLAPSPGQRGVLASALFADPEKRFLLHTPAGGSRHPATAETVAAGDHFLKMEGSGVFRHAVPMMEQATRTALERAGIELEDVDWIIPHQANARIVDSLVRRLGVSSDRVVVNLDRVANTSTASIPIALHEARQQGQIQPDDIVVMTAFGAGVTYGAVVLRV